METSYADYGDVMVTDDVEDSVDIGTMFTASSIYRASAQKSPIDESDEDSQTVVEQPVSKQHDSFKAFLTAQLHGAQRDLAGNHERLMQLVSSRLEMYSRMEVENKALKTKLEDLGFDDEVDLRSTSSSGTGKNNSRRSSNASVEDFIAEGASAKPNPKRGKARTAFGLAAVAEDKGRESRKRKPSPSPPDKNRSKKDGGAEGGKPRKPPAHGVPAPLAPAPYLESNDSDTDTAMSTLERVKSIASMESQLGLQEVVTPEDLSESAVTRYVSEGGKSRFSCNDVFEVLPVWKKDHKPLAAKLARMYVKAAKAEDKTQSIIAGPVTSQIIGLNRFRIWIVNPNSFRRGWWDMFSLLLVMYDMAVIPLQLFDPPEIDFFSVMTWVTRIFWTFDIPASFLTGYLKPDGSIEARPRKVAKNYVTTWFGLDLLIIAIDWCELLWRYGSVMGYARMGKASRTIRIVRMIRLLRLIRMRQVFRLLAERLQSERLIVFADIVRIMMIIVGLGHIIACVWYGIGAREEVQLTWVRVHNYELQELAYKYTTSLHWSLLLFSGGTDEIVPQNTNERVYAIFVYLLAFVMAAVFVSSLTSSMTQLHLLASQQQQKLSVLRRYLHQNGVSNGLALRVMRNAQHAVWEQKRLMPESQVELLMVVSEPLRVELHFELYSPVLAVHPFFAHYMEECPQVMRKVCHCCVGLHLISRGDVVFNAGEIPTHPKMYIICSGRMVYREISGRERQLNTGDWISEACLWCPWMHRGMFMGATECRLCLLDARKFQDIVGEFDHSDFDFDPKKYATDFVKTLNRSKNDVSDMPLPPESQVMLEVQESCLQARANRAKSPPTHPTIVAYGTIPEREAHRRTSVLMPVRKVDLGETQRENGKANSNTVAEIIASTTRSQQSAGESNGVHMPYQRGLIRKPSLLFTTPVPGVVREDDN